MQMYRFVTPHRSGKWYPDLETARAQANAIGAGFLDTRTGQFVQYPDTRIDRLVAPGQALAFDWFWDGQDLLASMSRQTCIG